jgi:hypothetical protein
MQIGRIFLRVWCREGSDQYGGKAERGLFEKLRVYEPKRTVTEVSENK